jgi:hypothetical protein
MPNSVSITDFDVLRKGQTELVTIFCKDPATDELVDVAGNSTFSMIDIHDDATKVTQVFGGAGAGVVTHPSTGVYQYSMNTTTYNQEYLLAFKCLLTGEVVNYNMFIKSVTARHFAYAAALRNQVDKARKSISDDIANMDKPSNEPSVRFFYGYSDAHLIYYLERGMQIINAVPPYTAMTVDTYPFDQYGSTLISSATLACAESAGIFSIDTDYNYSLGGNSLVLDHFTKLNTFTASLVARFDKQVVSFKQQFRTKGTVTFQWMPGGVRSARMLAALPNSFYSRMLSSVQV